MIGGAIQAGDIPPNPATGGGAGDLGKQYLKEYLAKTDPLFEEYLQKKIEEAATIGKIPAELLKRFLATARRGKKIRGALVMLGYEACGGKDRDAILDASLFIELFHAGVLVHDDFMDRDHLRRGLPTIHEQFKDIGKSLNVKHDPLHYGNAMEVNVGDAAYYLSWEKLMASSFPPDRLVDAGKIYADYIVRVVHGQVLDITTTSIQSITEKDILKVLRHKAAEYTGVLPLLVGATLAGEKDKEILQSMKDYGIAFGWAFQIQDDVLNIFGNEDDSGKPVGSDIREGKNTLLMLHLHRHGTDEQRAFQKRVLGNPNITKDDVIKMREILKTSGSYQYVVDLGWKYVKEGKKAIPHITTNPELRTILESLITYMMERIM